MKRSTDSRLRQHQRQRELGTSTVSVVTGVCTKAVEDLRTWAFHEGRNVVWMPLPSTAWIARHLATGAGPLTIALRGAAARYLASNGRGAGAPESGVQPVAGRGARRRAEDAEAAASLEACRVLLEPEAVAWERLDDDDAAADGTALRVLRAMLSLLWEVPLPAIVLSTPTDWANTERARGICEWACAMSDEFPRLPVVLVARHLPIDFVERRLSARVCDRIESGLITAQGALRPVLPYLGEEDEDEESEGCPRGDAMRALAEALAGHGETDGRFRPLAGGPRGAAHCLLARDARVAIQVVAKAPDRGGLLGRRDDAVAGALRDRAYFPVSFFADDVLADPDAVVDAVRAVLARRGLAPRRVAETRRIA